MKQISTNISIFLSTFILCSFAHHQFPKIKVVNDTIRDTIIIRDTIPTFLKCSPKEGLMCALKYYNVKHPKIVYAQAVLETGNFTSKGCTKDHNLFGLMRKGKHVKFKHWSESVEAYKKWIQHKHKPNENYYKFLTRIGYASDPNYISKLKAFDL